MLEDMASKLLTISSAFYCTLFFNCNYELRPQLFSSVPLGLEIAGINCMYLPPAG